MSASICFSCWPYDWVTYIYKTADQYHAFRDPAQHAELCKNLAMQELCKNRVDDRQTTLAINAPGVLDWELGHLESLRHCITCSKLTTWVHGEPSTLHQEHLNEGGISELMQQVGVGEEQGLGGAQHQILRGAIDAGQL